MTTTDELYDIACGLEDEASDLIQEAGELQSQAEDAWQEYYDAEQAEDEDMTSE